MLRILSYTMWSRVAKYFSSLCRYGGILRIQNYIMWSRVTKQNYSLCSNSVKYSSTSSRYFLLYEKAENMLRPHQRYESKAVCFL